MIDRRIPFKNIIMRCDEINYSISSKLPKGYSYKYYEEGDELHWAEIETDIGDFTSYDEALKYFSNKYLREKDELKKRCIFVIDENKEYVATCNAWHDLKDDKLVASLHWLATKVNNQGCGIGKALLSKTLNIYQENNELPIYLHTQPWSYKAIKLYSDIGFYICKEDTFSNYKNDYIEALSVIKDINPSLYNKLIIKSK